MTLHNLPARGPLFPSPIPAAENAPSTDLTYAVPMEEREGINWGRVVHALRRYKWIVIGTTVLGTAAGIVATRFVNAQYQVESTLWVDQLSRRGGQNLNGRPFSSGQFLEPEGWVDLLKSYQVLDKVVADLNLFLALKSPSDSTVMKTLRLKNEYVPGEYRLAVSGNGKTYVLSTDKGVELEHGTVGDSIGRRLGFLWAPRPETVVPGRKVQFRLDTPRDAASRLARELEVHMDPDGNFLRVVLAGSNPKRIAEIVNAITNRYVQVAVDLKKQNLVERTKTLSDQLDFQRKKLEDAEMAYSRFRTNTITLPGDRPAGADPRGDPLMASYIDLQLQKDSVRRDREALQRLLANPNDTAMAIGSLSAIGSVSVLSPELRDALKALTEKQSNLRALRDKYSDEFPLVQREKNEIATLQRQTIPSLGASVIRELSTREAELDQRVRSKGGSLQAIPARALDEERLKRDVTLAENLYSSLQQRFDEAHIEEASSTPDVRVLDAAVTPMRPAKNTAPFIVLLFFMASVGLASAGAVVLDRMDPRVRYPDQVSRDMGLTILGTVPHLKTRGGQYRLSRDEAAEVVEALRGVCMNIVYSHGASSPLMLTVTSPGAGDGKSFLCANLALTFADGGHRTLLVDADLRRGVLHQRFRVRRRPGLTDFLRGESDVASMIHATPFASLSFLSCGSRTNSAPELIGSTSMTKLMEYARANYDVIIVDSPPLSAGIDPCLLGALTGNLVMVLRTGVSDREMAEAKLQMLSRFPVRLLGAVLNDVPASGSYRYYSYYLPGYAGVEETAGDKAPRELV